MFLLGFEIIGIAVVVAKCVKYLPTILKCSDAEVIPCSVLCADAAEHSLLLAFAWKYQSVQLLVMCIVSLLNIGVLSCRNFNVKRTKQSKNNY